MRHFTLCWNTFIFLQFFNLINCRDVSASGMNSFHGLHKNFMTWLVLACIFAVQFFACFTWLGRPVFETRAISDRDFFVTVAAAASVLVANNLLKLIPEALVSKIPTMDEEKAMGSENAIMRVYDEQATGEFPGAAAQFGLQNDDKDQDVGGDGDYASDDYRQA